MIEYASASARLERRAEISAAQRQQLVWLSDQVIDYGSDCLTRAEFSTLVKLQNLQGIMSDTATTPLIPQRPPHRSMTASTRRRMLETLEMRWPKPRQNGKAAQLELLRMLRKPKRRLTSRQKQVAMLETRWGPR
jgi:hypothetical protein